MMLRHFISLKYVSAEQINHLIKLTTAIKRKSSTYRKALSGKSIGLLFEKPSLRTKAAFYVGALGLGAGAVYFSPNEVQLGKREAIGDVSHALSRFIDVVVLRTFSHRNILDFAKFSGVPVVNGLSELCHPTQVLADIFTMHELKGKVNKLKVAYIGDGNNVCHSLLYAFSILGGKLYVATPKKYQPNLSVVKEAKQFARVSGAKINFVDSAKKAATQADVLYTDVWTSMGREKEKVLRKKAFKNFQINDTILKKAKANCIVMHCLPAHRGEEITDSVIDGKHSAVFLQAENRLHTAKALLVYLLGAK